MVPRFAPRPNCQSQKDRAQNAAKHVASGWRERRRVCSGAVNFAGPAVREIREDSRRRPWRPCVPCQGRLVHGVDEEIQALGVDIGRRGRGVTWAERHMDGRMRPWRAQDGRNRRRASPEEDADGAGRRRAVVRSSGPAEGGDEEIPLGSRSLSRCTRAASPGRARRCCAPLSSIFTRPRRSTVSRTSRRSGMLLAHAGIETAHVGRGSGGGKGPRAVGGAVEGGVMDDERTRPRGNGRRSRRHRRPSRTPGARSAMYFPAHARWPRDDRCRANVPLPLLRRHPSASDAGDSD